MQNIADHGAGRRGDDANGAWGEWQRFLQPGREQAFAMQLLLQAFQLRQKCANTGNLHGFDDDLIFRRRREGRNAAGNDDLQAIIGLGLQPADIALPDDAVDGRLVVLER